jgi:hypothetical protein
MILSKASSSGIPVVVTELPERPTMVGGAVLVDEKLSERPDTGT